VEGPSSRGGDSADHLAAPGLFDGSIMLLPGTVAFFDFFPGFRNRSMRRRPEGRRVFCAIAPSRA